MTPQEKAEELVNKYLLATPVGFHIDDAKKCALIAVDEILHSLEYNTWQNRKILKYYKEVKQEIEKL